MSILIKGMEMPNNCDDCRVDIDCPYDESQDGYKMMGGRPRKCPLVPVSEHGRLGDLDALHAHLTEWYLQNKRGLYPTEAMYIRAMLAGIKDAPAIIEAEEGE